MVDWTHIRGQLASEIASGTQIRSLRNTLRIITSVDESTGFRVRVGQKSRTTLVVPWEMLETCYEVLASPSGYDTGFFQSKFPDRYEQHDCYVHVVGQLFVKANLAELVKRDGKYLYFSKN